MFTFENMLLHQCHAAHYLSASIGGLLRRKGIGYKITPHEFTTMTMVMY